MLFRKYHFVVQFIFFLGLFAWLYWRIENNKIRFVRTGVVLEQYKGMKEANKKFSAEFSTAAANADTLKGRLEIFLKDKASMKNREAWEYQVRLQENELRQYQANAEKQLQQRKSELTSKVLSDINTFIKEYAEKHHYTIVLGATNDGNILYAEEKEDITDKLVEELNNRYDKK